MSLLVVGTVAFDALETPFGKVDKIVGGAATYIVLAASYLYKDIDLVSVVGGDFPTEVLEDLQRRGANIEGLQIKKDEKTFFWSGKYHTDMNTRDTIETQLNVLENFDPIIPERSREPEFLLLGNLMPIIQQKVLNQLTKRPKFIILDTMNFWMEIALPDLLEALKNVDLLTINDEEARLLSGEYSLVKAAKKILTLGPKNLVIKKGEHGALLFSQDEVFFIPALPLAEVFDPTGAGDSFAGGLAGYLAKTDDISFENLKRALAYATVMASFCVEKFGTERTQNLTEQEINDRIQELVKLGAYDLSPIVVK